MSGDTVLQRILSCGVVAIVRLRETADLLRVVEAIADGGIDVVEFTLTTPGALQSLQTAQERFGERVVLGAGTVLDPETTRMAITAGARFIVAPTLNEDVIRLCRRYSVPAIPGAYTPTEILRAWEAGASLVKVFPATSLGPSYFKDVLAPLPQVRLVPTGGVNLATIGPFIAAGASAVAVGSNLVDAATVARGDYATITERACGLVAAVREARQA